MNIRKCPLVTNNVYHIFNKSIEGYQIFNTDFDYLRMLDLLRYYQFANVPVRYSHFNRLSIIEQNEINDYLLKKNNKIVEIIAYCIMPTHYHLILMQLIENGISIFANQIQNSYAKYFNTKHDRRGPLWQGYFKNVIVESDNQLLHLTRYIHLNPSSAKLVHSPIEWKFSSYCEYTDDTIKNGICDFRKIHTIDNEYYKKFVEGRIDYQRALTKIKKLILE